MEKLLHERLREVEVFDDIRLSETYISVQEKVARELADEIERYYIPRPRFEDGEPVQFGDEAQIGDLVFTVKGFRIFDGVNDGLLREWNKSYDACFCKRPTPNVYDADGVEIKVGDTVYREDGEKLTVKQLFIDGDCGECFTSEEWGVGQVAKYFTHERPVFDANNERIFKGDTVWTLSGHGPFTVLDLPDPDYYQSIQVESVESGYKTGYDPNRLTHERPVFDAEGVMYAKGQTVWSLGGIEYIVEEVIDDDHIRTRFHDSEKAHATFTSRTLTHREPDSLEKLQDFLGALANRYSSNVDLMSQLDKAYDMCTALIERGA